MDLFARKLDKGLVWLPELGMGHYPVPRNDRPYDAIYISRYQEMAKTEMGYQLTEKRIQLVSRHYTGTLLDVGIGAGQFVESRENTQGYDVNPLGIQWLQQRGLWADLYSTRYPALSFWDSLEHIDRPDVAVGQAQGWVFVSVPIFENGEHVLLSKHFKPKEHIWYWTHQGLVDWFQQMGFELAEYNDAESLLGREGIRSYAFKRTNTINSSESGH